MDINQETLQSSEYIDLMELSFHEFVRASTAKPIIVSHHAKESHGSFDLPLPEDRAGHSSHPIFGISSVTDYFPNDPTIQGVASKAIISHHAKESHGSFDPPLTEDRAVFRHSADKIVGVSSVTDYFPHDPTMQGAASKAIISHHAKESHGSFDPPLTEDRAVFRHAAGKIFGITSVTDYFPNDPIAQGATSKAIDANGFQQQDRSKCFDEAPNFDSGSDTEIELDTNWLDSIILNYSLEGMEEDAQDIDIICNINKDDIPLKTFFNYIARNCDLTKINLTSRQVQTNGSNNCIEDCPSAATIITANDFNNVQNVLVENIKRISEKSNDRRKPTVQQVSEVVAQHTANHVPLKQRFDNRSQDKPQPNYNKIDPTTTKKRKGKIEVISNEIVSGPLLTVRTDTQLPLNQILYLNPDYGGTSTFGGSGVLSFSQIRIDADTPMLLQDISLGNNVVSSNETIDAMNTKIVNSHSDVQKTINPDYNGYEKTTFNEVLNFLINREDEGIGAVTYVVNSRDDGSVEVDLNCNPGMDAADEMVDATDFQSDSDAESDANSESDSDSEVDLFRILHLGSNNYRDNMGYIYSKNNERNGHLYLRCKNSVQHGCKARVTVRDKMYADAVMTIKHNHPHDVVFTEKQIFDKKLEENIKQDPFSSPRQLYLKTKTDLLGKIDPTNIPPLKKKGGFIFRRQKQFIPRLPSTIEEFEEFISDEKYQKCFSNDHRNLPYYRGVWTSVKGERNLVYISETVLKMINSMNNAAFFIDGTYKALPHHLKFRQLYVISIIYCGQCYPFAYIFMEKKTFTSYDTVFANLKLLMPSVLVVKVMSDYEAATRKAIRKHYPQARISGCFFHYVQAIVKSSKKFGLRRDDRFREALKQVCALALLPNEFVLKGFETIVSTFNFKSIRWNRFKKYWLKQWSTANISVYGLEHRTNNFSETNNKSLNLLLKSRHPNIWILIKTLKLLEMDKSDHLIRASKGEMIVTKSSRDMIRLNEKIEKATKLFDEEEDIGKFLQRVTFEENLDVFVKDRVNIMSDVDEEDEEDEEVIPNHYNIESDFRKNHPRAAAMPKK